MTTRGSCMGAVGVTMWIIPTPVAQSSIFFSEVGFIPNNPLLHMISDRHHSGTSVKLHGGGGAASLDFILDGNDSNLVFGNTNTLIESTVIFSAGDLADEDHQLLVLISMPTQDGLVTLNYVECVDPLFYSDSGVLR